MNGVVLDTHALVWYLNAPEKLSSKAASAIDSTLRAGFFLNISAISLIELIYLTEKGKVPRIAMQSLLDALDTPQSGVREISVHREISDQFHAIPRADVPDMPDRIIAATALYLNLPLITRDSKILTSSVNTIW